MGDDATLLAEALLLDVDEAVHSRRSDMGWACHLEHLRGELLVLAAVLDDELHDGVCAAVGEIDAVLAASPPVVPLQSAA